MNNFLHAAGAGWFYECTGPESSVVLTRSAAEALFWHRIGYVIRHAAYKLP